MSDDKTQVAVQQWSDEIIRQIAMDIGKEVVAHIEWAYPDACRAVAWESAKISIRNACHNALIASINAASEGRIEPLMASRAKHRRAMRRSFSKRSGGEDE